eukprot:TRINITY_DN3562_c0_g1_i1.p1 TRINITY_DN3562_c0_g1~~TRINITY_DN3562_c0_g1_i1.p1  ORF type:complete len:266 (+),score=64.30 TRINITY_DN3562_c0_g1_i1:36-800(+)
MSKRTWNDKVKEEGEEEEEEEEEDSSDETSSEEEGTKSTVVVGNLEGKLETIYTEELKKRLKGALSISVDWSTRMAMVEYKDEEAAAQAVSETDNMSLFGSVVRAGPSSGKSAELCVTNISSKTTDEDIRKLMEVHGSVLTCSIKQKDDGTRRCFVRFSDPSFAKAALKETDGTILHSSRLTVVEPPPMVIKPKEEKDTKGGKGGKGGKGDRKGGKKNGDHGGKGGKNNSKGKDGKGGKKGKGKNKRPGSNAIR